MAGTTMDGSYHITPLKAKNVLFKDNRGFQRAATPMVHRLQIELLNQVDSSLGGPS
jgi:hypothetical protein